MCVLIIPFHAGPVPIVVGDTKRYQSSSSFAYTISTKLTVTVCTGNAALYVCLPGPGTKCNPWSYPGPQGAGGGPNYDYFIPVDSTLGTATWLGASGGLLFWGITTTNPVPGWTNGSVTVSLTEGDNSPTLVLPPSPGTLPAVSRDAVSFTYLTLSWLPPALVTGPNSILPRGLQYDIYLFAAGTPPNAPGYHLEKACGLEAAHAACSGGCALKITVPG